MSEKCSNAKAQAWLAIRMVKDDEDVLKIVCWINARGYERIAIDESGFIIYRGSAPKAAAKPARQLPAGFRVIQGGAR
jgi:hypothetical protein